jgi:hypothetical protein
MPKRQIDLADEKTLTTSGIHAYINSNGNGDKLQRRFLIDCR